MQVMATAGYRSKRMCLAAGPVLVTHFSLLLGMAVPIWLSSIPSTFPGKPIADLGPAFAGIIILGLADSAASAVGRRFGQIKILGTQKTFEGTIGGVILALAGWAAVWPLCCRLVGTDGGAWNSNHACAIVAATLGSCVLEAATTQLDNIFLPMHHFAMLLLV